MEKLGRAGSTIYVFDSSTGEGASFTSLGKFIANIHYSNVSLVLRSTQDVEVLSILGSADLDMCDVYFGGKAGTCPMCYSSAVAKTKGMANMGIAPLRIFRQEEAGLLQVMLIFRPNTLSEGYLKGLLNIKEWR